MIYLLLALLACPADVAPLPAAVPGVESTYYTCPMHAAVHEAAPGRCPICGMDLVPVTGGGTGAVHVGAAERERFGVHTVKARDGVLTRTVRFAGTVGWDLRRQTDVAVRAPGTVTALRVSVGSAVRAGDALFSLQSPELLAAQADLLASSGPTGASAEARLVALGLTSRQVAGLRASGVPLTTFPILAPVAGVVTTLDAVEGSPVTTGTAVLRLADAGAVWIEANVSGVDSALLVDGTSASIRADGMATMVGKVHPLASGEAVARVRVDVAAGSGLRPGAVVVVEVPVSSPAGVVVPVDAVVFAGTRHVVFVEENGEFLPREVSVGVKAGEEVVVTGGVAAGDTVVASGAFLVAADSRLRDPSAWETP